MRFDKCFDLICWKNKFLLTFIPRPKNVKKKLVYPFFKTSKEAFVWQYTKF